MANHKIHTLPGDPHVGWHGKKHWSPGYGWRENVTTYESTNDPRRPRTSLCPEHDSDSRAHRQVYHGLHLGRCDVCQAERDRDNPDRDKQNYWEG